MSCRFPQHPDRGVIHDEAHARPPLAIPDEIGEVWHWALVTDTQCSKWPDEIQPDQRHQLITFDHGVLRYERHAEFFALTWAGKNAPDAKVNKLIGACPGQQLAGVRILFKAPDSDLSSDFGEARIFGGAAMFDGVSVATDFQLTHTGLVTYVVAGVFEDGFARGRLAKRLLDIENYRMAALMALPLVQQRMGLLHALEERATGATRELPAHDDPNLKTLVDELSRVLAELGELKESVRFRLAASKAYYDLVTDRLSSLDEKPLGHRQTLKGFIDHRLSPALKTAEAFDRRLTDLSHRVTSALALARTRLDVMIEMQNQSLLKKMEERARQQVRLSEAVEGLSTAAITYYAIGLLIYLLKGLPDLPISDEHIVAAAIPFAALVVWQGTSRARKRIMNEDNINV